MPQQEIAFLPDDAVLWMANGFDDYGKAKVTDLPVTIRVKWNDSEKQRTQPDGTTITISASLVVDREIRVGSAMAKGTAEEWLDGGYKQLYEVIGIDSSKDLKGRSTARTVQLMKSKRVLPTSP